MSVPAQGPIQLPSHWALGLKGLGHEALTSFDVLLRLRISGNVHMLLTKASWYA